MMTSELTPQEIKQIDIEARDYAWTNYDKDKGDWITFKTVYAAALTREREKVKEVVQKASNILLLTEEDGTPVDGFRYREMILELKQAITNYQKTKEQ